MVKQNFITECLKQFRMIYFQSGNVKKDRCQNKLDAFFTVGLNSDSSMFLTMGLVIQQYQTEINRCLSHIFQTRHGMVI